MSDKIAVVLGGLIAAISGAAMQYLISYKLIEEPRLKIESQRLALDATNQMQKLIPSIDADCSAQLIIKWQYKIVCNFENRSHNPVWVAIQEISLVSKNDAKARKYAENTGYQVEYPNNRRRYLSFPGDKGYIDAYLTFDRKVLPHGINTNKVDGFIKYETTTHPEALRLVSEEFTELRTYAAQIAKRNSGFVVALPSTVIR